MKAINDFHFNLSDTLCWDIEKGTLLKLGLNPNNDCTVNEAILGYDKLSTEKLEEMYGKPPVFRRESEWSFSTPRVMELHNENDSEKEENGKPYWVLASYFESCIVPVIC